MVVVEFFEENILINIFFEFWIVENDEVNGFWKIFWEDEEDVCNDGWFFVLIRWGRMVVI